jgi:ribosomal protein S18 acetylase RimI-like enzyme
MSTDAIEYCLNKAAAAQIAAHLAACDAAFVPPLSSRVDVVAYAGKIAARAQRFEAWLGGELTGLVAAYLDAEPGFVTNVSVLPGSTGRGIASTLLRQCIDRARQSGLRGLRLEVAADNIAAVRLYETIGFAIRPDGGATLAMNLELPS